MANEHTSVFTTDTQLHISEPLDAVGTFCGNYFDDFKIEAAAAGVTYRRDGQLAEGFALAVDDFPLRLRVERRAFRSITTSRMHTGKQTTPYPPLTGRITP